MFVCVPMYIPHGQDLDKFVCFDSLRPSQQFSVMSGRVSLGQTSTKQRIKYLAQGHNAVPLRLVRPSLRQDKN